MSQPITPRSATGDAIWLEHYPKHGAPESVVMARYWLAEAERQREENIRLRSEVVALRRELAAYDTRQTV